MGYLDRGKQAEYQATWLQKRRSEWIAAQGGCCSQCQSSIQLEVDHIDRDLKTMQPAAIWSRSKEVQARELSNCQVLCYACHKAKTRSELISTTHGTAALYNKHHCRCEQCREWNRSRVSRQRTLPAEGIENLNDC